MPPVSGRHVPRHVSSNWSSAVQLKLPSHQSEALRRPETKKLCFSVLYIHSNWCKLLHSSTFMTCVEPEVTVTLCRHARQSLQQPSFVPETGRVPAGYIFHHLFKQRTKFTRLWLTSFLCISKHVSNPPPPFWVVCISVFAYLCYSRNASCSNTLRCFVVCDFHSERQEVYVVNAIEQAVKHCTGFEGDIFYIVFIFSSYFPVFIC